MPQEDATSPFATMTLDRKSSVDTYQYNIPESDEVQEYRLRQEKALSDRDIEEQATPESIRAGMIDLYDDRSDLDYLRSEYAEPAAHSQVSSVVEKTYADERSQEDKMHEIVGNMEPLAQTKMIIETGHYVVTILRPEALEMSKLPR